MKFHPSLKTMLTINFILASILPILLIGLVALHNIGDSLQNEITNKNFLVAQSLSGEVERFLGDSLGLLQQVVVTVYEKKLIDEEFVNEYLDSVINNYASFDMIRILDEYGVVKHLAPYESNFLGINMSGQDFFKQTMLTQKPYWSPTFISGQTGDTSLTICIPLEKGLVVGYLNLNTLSAISARRKIGLSGYATIVDQKGITIAHPDRRFVSERLDVKNHNIIQRGLAGTEGTFKYKVNGERLLGSIAVIPNLNWIVAVIQPVKEVFAPVKRIRVIILIGIMIAVLFVAVVALISLRNILHPLTQLAENSKRITEGYYDFDIPPSPYPEIGELAHNFEIMIDAVKSREERIKSSEAKFRGIFENATEGIFQVDSIGRLIVANPALLKIMGYDLVEEVTCMVFEFDKDFFVDESRMEKFLFLLDKHGIVKDFECDCYRKDKTIITASLTVRVMNEKKSVTHYEGILKDITHKREIEKYKRAKENAEIANRAKSEFLANMSHELRTPLNAVIGFSELLSIGSLDTKQKSYVKSILTAGKSLLMLINDILDLSKIESGMLVIKPGVFNIKEALDSIMRIFKLKTEKKGINFIIDIDNEIPTALILDEVRMRQILLNLIGNAVKFTDKGYIKVSVKKVLHGKNDWYGITISVEDTGIGIPPESIDSIFDSFKQHDGLDTKKFGGTGLGLSICKKLIVIMGGEISVTSTPGKGSCFTVTLNDVKEASHDNAIFTPEELFEIDNITFGDATVLVVDDIESNRMMVREILEKVGFSVLTAENGKRALELVKSHPVDFIFMDIRMPVMDGYKAIVLLRENPETKGIPVIALTASTSIDNKQSILQSGFDGFLRKPFKVNELLFWVSRFFPYDTKSSEKLHFDSENMLDYDAVKEPKVLLRSLNNDILPSCNYLQDVMIMSQIKILSNEIITLGEKHEVLFFSQYGKKLMTFIDSFDTVAISDVLKAIVSCIETLNQRWGGDDEE